MRNVFRLPKRIILAIANLATWLDKSGQSHLARQCDERTRYRIEYSVNNSTWYTLGSVGANVTAVQITGTAANTTYYFRVKAVNSYGAPAASNAGSVRSPAASLPVSSQMVGTDPQDSTQSSTTSTTAATTRQRSNSEQRFGQKSGRSTAADRGVLDDLKWLESLLDRWAHRR